MKLESAALTLIFNGEIYNYRELRNELKVRGCRFRSQADPETLLHAWFEWGPSWSASEYALSARL
jgi:asparagine synthase (glutamine-hydrolysing)